MSGGGGDGGAGQMEADRRRRVDQAVGRINDIFGSKDHPAHQGLYDEQQKAVTDLNTREVNRQFEQAERANRFGLARSGLMGGSADVDSQAELSRRTNEGLMKAAGLGQQAAADLRGADERTRQNLISMAQSGLESGQAAQMALAGLDLNAKNAAAQRTSATLDNLFGNLGWAYLARQQQAGQRPWGYY